MDTTTGVINITLVTNVQWKLYLVNKDGLPFKLFMYEQDANMCILKMKLVMSDKDFEIAEIPGSEVKFDIPIGTPCTFEYEKNECHGVYIGNGALKKFTDTFTLDKAHDVFGSEA